ncbi:hypothetical protein A1O7_02833 [Cladophialophora yegresii CBS 114405]|uniref:Uncharacterized protein n=1 Tax=Cladophialophora yegresii CBS 114405 TaxID=1182544 RepID=W9W388_9EURO|nr:uncharacterized protein A1O7_02833 [Cladophialophora yegresii CBS 114405]EXJ62398.1 hypothetical protein A1O7_02833 [Cladophialophora yegresii CBS 114405]
MAYVDLGYSAFEQSDEFLHPETGCVLTLRYGQANVRHYMGGNHQDTRPVLRRPEDLLFRISHPAGYTWDDYASGPEQMEQIIGLPKRDNPWDRWIVRGDVPLHGRFEIGTLDQLRSQWNDSLPDVAPGVLTAHQPPPAGTCAETAKGNVALDRMNRGGPMQAPIPAVDQAIVARQRLGGPSTAFDQAYPGVRIPQPVAGPNVGAPQVHQPLQQVQAAPPSTHQAPPVQQQHHQGHQGQDQPDDDMIDPFLLAVQAGQLAGQQPYLTSTDEQGDDFDDGAGQGYNQQ